MKADISTLHKPDILILRRQRLLCRLTYPLARPKIRAKCGHPRYIGLKEGRKGWNQSAVVLLGTHSSRRQK
jgi:hypothetical protein